MRSPRVRPEVGWVGRRRAASAGLCCPGHHGLPGRKVPFLLVQTLGRVVRFLHPPVEPCMRFRFSRTRLTDTPWVEWRLLGL